MHMYVYTGIGFNMTRYVLREGLNHTIPVVITGGSLPVATQIKVNPNFDIAGKRFMYVWVITVTAMSPNLLGPEDINLYTTDLNLRSDSLREDVILEAIRDGFKKENDIESFRLDLVEPTRILPGNVMLGTTVIEIQNVGR